MSPGHCALIVEDDEEIAADLGELLRAIYPDVEVHVADNQNRAIALLDERVFCFVLLDLKIKREPTSLRGTVEAGIGVLVEIRRRYPEHTGKGFRLPVIVITASISARERDAAVGVMSYGASDLIGKPFGPDTAAHIREAMVRGGRPDHAHCRTHEKRMSDPDELGLVIEILPYEASRKKGARVRLGGSILTLSPALLYALLRLMAAKARGQRVDAGDLSRSNRPHQVISDLRNRLSDAQVPGAQEMIKNDDGKYWLRDDVVIGPIDLNAVERLGARPLLDVATEIVSTRR